MDEEQALASPIAGGINAVRRNMSSGLFGARRQNQTQQSDSITTNLLTNQSLELKTVTRQLEVISNQMTSINTSLSGVKENLILSDTIERKRERAKQNRERQLVEQGLREGKESDLEKKIQTALVSPVKRIGEKAQGVLFSFQKFFLLLAGGWLTNVGIDLINALVTGNTDLIKKLQQKFTIGLVAIGGTITALNVGVKKILFGLKTFTQSIARFAFGNFIGNTLGGLRAFLKNVAVRAGLAAAGGGFFGGATGGAFAGGVAGGTAGATILNRIDRAITNLRLNLVRTGGLADKAILDPKFLLAGKDAVIQDMPPTIDAMPKASLFGRIKNRLSGVARKFLPGAGQTGAGFKATQQLVIPGITEGVEQAAKGGVLSAIKKFASKGLSKFLKTGGPLGIIIDMALRIAMGESIGDALAGAAKATVLFTIGQTLLPFLPLVGGLIGIFLGEFLLNKFGKLLKNIFGIKLPKAIVGDLGDGEGDTSNQLTIDDYKIVESTEDNISAISNNNAKIADNLVEQETSSMITIPLAEESNLASAPPMTGGKEPGGIPAIPFNEGNPHTLYAVSQLGVA